MISTLARQLSVVSLVIAAFATALPAQTTGGGIDLTLNGSTVGPVLTSGQLLSVVAQNTLTEDSHVFIVGSLASPVGGLSFDSLVILASQSVMPMTNVSLSFHAPLDGPNLRVALQAFALTTTGQLHASPIRVVKFRS